jgi:hypothetical protein
VTLLEEPERTALYRLHDTEGRLLYLGISKLPKFRWERHATHQPWWHLVARKTVVWYPNRGEALAAEEKFTAIEKPLYDRSAHGVKHHPAERFDNSADALRVGEWLEEKMEELEAGTRLMTGQVASACGVARTTASSAMRRFSQMDSRLRFLIHGRYIVDAA